MKFEVPPEPSGASSAKLNKAPGTYSGEMDIHQYLKTELLNFKNWMLVKRSHLP